VPCRRPRAEETRSTTPRGEAAEFHHASTAETAYNSGEDEKVAGETRSSVAGHCHLEKSDGGDTETLAGVGQSLHTF
jgi:hypothetical protein